MVPGDGALINWLLGICATLIATGIGGVWQLSTSVAKLQTTVANWSKIYEDRFVFVSMKVDEHERRIGSLEAKVNGLNRVR